MKNLKRLILGTLIALSTLSCKKEEPIEPCHNSDSDIVEMKIEINGNMLPIGYEHIECDIVLYAFEYTDENGVIQTETGTNILDDDDDSNNTTNSFSFKFNKNEYYSFYFVSGVNSTNNNIPPTSYTEQSQNWDLYLDGELWSSQMSKKRVFFQNILSFRQ